MNALRQVGAWLKKAFLLAVTLACVFVVSWGILYKIFLSVTPLWLDKIAIVAVPLALLVAWAIGKAAERPEVEDEKNVKPAHAVPDAAAQLMPDEPDSPPLE